MTIRRGLIRRLAALLTTTALACAALLAAYYGVSRNSPEVTDRTAPAIVAVAVADASLKTSFDDARTSVTGRAGPVEGPGEGYRAELTSAVQALAKATANTVAGEEGRQTLSTVSALVSSYSYLVQQAARNATDEPLRDAYLANARSMLWRPGSGIHARLEDVQTRQRRVLDQEVSFDWPPALAWAGALVLGVALLVLLAETQIVLRRRFRRRVNPGLAAGTLLVAALVPTLTVLAVQIQDRLRSAAARIEHDRKGHGIDDGTLTWVRGHMSGAHWRAGATTWIVLTAVVVAALILIGLQPRLDEYRFRHLAPAGPAKSRLGALVGNRAHQVIAAVLAAWLVALGSLGYVEYRDRQQSRITVLASWSDQEQQRFRKVLDAFERRHPGISVDYQGTTALREVLLARRRTATAPDLAILPSSGEVADYAATNGLKPLDTVLPRTVRTTYGPKWAFQADGHVYAVAVKAELKSIAWYDAAAPPEDPAALARDGAHWCAGMGGDDTVGWPGTDWIEDILLQQSGKDAYERLADGSLPWDSDAMTRAWRTFGGIFTAGPAKDALSKDYRDGLFHQGAACALEHQGTFVRSGYPEGRKPDFTPSPALLPDVDRHSTAREVSADYAALFRDSPAARELLAFLTTPDAQRTWADPGGSTDRGYRADNPFRPFFPFAPVREQRAFGAAETLNAHIDRELRGASVLCLDASDSMPPRMRFAFQHGVLDYLSAPGPDRLTSVLRDLETVRAQLAPRQQGACS
ncbi:ABC transporter substrate-binding protein [Streptomyces sp. NPDC002537]